MFGLVVQEVKLLGFCLVFFFGVLEFLVCDCVCGFEALEGV